MTLSLHVHGGYPSYKESGAEWRSTDYDAFKLVQVLKGKPIKGYATLKDVEGTFRTVTTQHSLQAFQIFGRWAARKLEQLNRPPGLLVPVPSSTCITIGDDPKGKKLAETIQQHTNGHYATDALCWSELMPKTSEGGTRNADELYSKLRVLTGFGKTSITLVDDVVTTGGHAVACARALRSFGHNVELVLAAAQTVWAHPEGDDMFSIPARDLEAPPINIFGEF